MGKGSTVLELLVVAVIIMILAAIAVNASQSALAPVQDVESAE